MIVYFYLRVNISATILCTLSYYMHIPLICIFKNIDHELTTLKLKIGHHVLPSAL